MSVGWICVGSQPTLTLASQSCKAIAGIDGTDKLLGHTPTYAGNEPGCLRSNSELQEVTLARAQRRIVIKHINRKGFRSAVGRCDIMEAKQEFRMPTPEGFLLVGGRPPCILNARADPRGLKRNDDLLETCAKRRVKLQKTSVISLLTVCFFHVFLRLGAMPKLSLVPH